MNWVNSYKYFNKGFNFNKLNEILNKEIIFSVEYYKPSGFDFDEIKGMVEEIVNESIEKNNLKDEKEEIQRRIMDDFYSGKGW